MDRQTIEVVFGHLAQLQTIGAAFVALFAAKRAYSAAMKKVDFDE